MKHQKQTRLLSALLAFALLLAFVPQLPTAARAAEPAGSCGNNLTWRFDEESGVLTVTGSGAMDDYDPIEGQPWRPYREKIAAIVLPQGLTSVGEFAFEGCSGLTSVTIPDSVTSIGNFAFVQCEKLEAVQIPESVAEIKDGTFSGCAALAEITLPDSITSIGGGAFQMCSLRELTIPKNVAQIGYRFVDNCEKLTAISVHPDNTHYCSENGVLFKKNKALNQDKAVLIRCPEGKTGAYQMPNDVLEIETGAFENCERLTAVTLSDRLMYIGDWAFWGCGGLEELYIPACVFSIGEKAFMGCFKMKEFSVDPKNREYCSEDGVLFNKDKSQLIRIPDRKSGSYRVPDSVRMIDYSALTNCAELESITLPAGVEFLEVNSFLDCSKLKEILISPESSLYVSRDGVLFSRDQTKLVRFPAGRTGEYRIPEGVRTICSDAFETSALASVTLPESVTVVENAAFDFCPNLKTFSFPAGVREIRSGALYCCNALERVTVWNPECSIDNDLIALSNDETISVPVLCGYRGSTLAAYAEENGLPFEEIESKTGFADVKDDAYYADPIAWAVAQDVTTGVTPYYFSPDKTCSRAQAVTFLWRAKGCPEPTLTDNPFVDVKPDQYYYNAVLWAVENGVTNGLDDTHFGPDKGCTRAQVVTFLWRSEGKPDAAGLDDPFTDVASDQYYTEPVLWAVEKGITKGSSPDKFSPDSTCTRSQIVTFLYRDLK